MWFNFVDVPVPPVLLLQITIFVYGLSLRLGTTKYIIDEAYNKTIQFPGHCSIMIYLEFHNLIEMNGEGLKSNIMFYSMFFLFLFYVILCSSSMSVNFMLHTFYLSLFFYWHYNRYRGIIYINVLISLRKDDTDSSQWYTYFLIYWSYNTVRSNANFKQINVVFAESYLFN